MKNAQKCTQKIQKMQKMHTEIAKITQKNAKNDTSGIIYILPGLLPIGYPQ
jgi:hypothetical protein